MRARVVGPLVVALAGLAGPAAPAAREDLRLGSPATLQLLVVPENAAPTLRLVLPGQPTTERAIEILFPEHITAVRQGRADPEQLYRWVPGPADSAPAWRRTGQSLEYQRDLPGAVQVLARATLATDGVGIRYEFRNRSDVDYAMIYAVTDPRLTAAFQDLRLERTYVHYPGGLALLAAGTPARLKMPLDQWLPARYLASFTWPVPDQRVERRGDGITYYHAATAVDQPFIATVSSDGRWVVASVTRTTGNVWTNPALTCQHVDPQTSLPAGGFAAVELKLLVMRDSLATVFRHAVEVRGRLAAPSPNSH